MIITGHGSYAPGMTGAMEMIAGEQEKVLTIPFLQGMSLEDYQKEIANGIETLTQEGLEIIIFTDLLGVHPIKPPLLQPMIKRGRGRFRNQLTNVNRKFYASIRINSCQ